MYFDVWKMFLMLVRKWVNALCLSLLPIENVELFEKKIPGHFVAEGLDQACGWFHTLMVLSTGLFGKPAFKNLTCNGLVIAEDGKK